jgi:hypothetical protein
VEEEERLTETGGELEQPAANATASNTEETSAKASIFLSRSKSEQREHSAGK